MSDLYVKAERHLTSIGRGASILHPLDNYWCKLLSIGCFTRDHKVMAYEMHHTTPHGGNTTTMIPADVAGRVTTTIWAREHYWNMQGVKIPYNVRSYMQHAQSLRYDPDIEEMFVAPNWWILPVYDPRPPVYGLSEATIVLEESNNIVMQRELGGCVEGVLESFCVDGAIRLVVNDEHRDVFIKAMELSASLLDYHVLCEMHHSEMEYERSHEVWAEYGTWKDRLHYIRERRGEFELEHKTLGEVLQMVRGEWFGGYASELLSRVMS